MKNERERDHTLERVEREIERGVISSSFLFCYYIYDIIITTVKFH